MNRILIGAVALSLLGGSVASAQPYNPYQGQENTYQGQDNGYRQEYHQDRGDRQYEDRRHGDDRSYGEHQHGRDWRDGDQRGWRHGRYDGYRACRWRHHHRVCYR